MKTSQLKFILGLSTFALGLSAVACGESSTPTKAGAGGGGGSGGSSGATGETDSSAAAGTGGSSVADLDGGGLPTDTDLIVDFEVPNDAGGPAILANAGRNGGWFVFDDGSLDVHPDGMPEAAVDLDAGIGSYLPGKMLLGSGLEEAMLDMPHVTFPSGMPSAKALHVHGGPYRGSYGSGFGTNLNAAQSDGSDPDASMVSLQMPYDGSAYAGVVFFTKMAPMTQATLRFSISTTESEMGFGSCEAAGCFNDFGVDLTMKTEWTAHVVKFSAMTQKPYKSYMPPGGFAKDKMISLKFLNVRVPAFDFWVDDIAFFK
jgi:hypothetical protein